MLSKQALVQIISLGKSEELLLLEHWDFELNEENPKTDPISRSRQFYWKCEKFNHSYTITFLQIKKGQRCNICAGKVIVPGINDFASQCPPELFKQWDREKNKEIGLSPEKVTINCPKVSYWICDIGHSYSKRVKHFTSSCSYCSGRKVLEGFNDIATTHPELMPEWSPKNAFDPTKISAGQALSVLWECPVGHEYKSVLYERANPNRKRGCPYCAGHLIMKGFNDFASKYPALIREWSPNNKKNPDEVFANSKYSALWVCQLGHEYKSEIGNKVTRNQGCLVCLNRKILAGFNDLMTTHPALCKEWDYTQNIVLPSNLTSGLATKVFWVCLSGLDHPPYAAKVYNRAKLKQGCPNCNMANSSKIEQAFFMELKSLFPHALNGSRLDIWFKKKPYLSVDILLLAHELKIVLEYDGAYNHDGRRSGKGLPWHLEHDGIKTNVLLAAGFTVVRIRGDQLPHLQLSDPNLFQISHAEVKGNISATVATILGFLKGLQ